PDYKQIQIGKAHVKMAQVGRWRELTSTNPSWEEVVAMPSRHLLSVGCDPILMRSRFLVLRHAGFRVDEAYNIRDAFRVIKSDRVDDVVLCHTLFKDAQRLLVSGAREARGLLPILCITMQSHDLPEAGCMGVENDPAELVKSVRRALGEGF